MKKDFTEWHRLKTLTNNDYLSPLFQEREIWWCSIGQNIGHEEDGKNQLFERPVLIFHKFNNEMFWGVAITSKEKYGKYDYLFSFRGRKRTLLLSQLRIFSAQRLIRRIGKIKMAKFIRIRNAYIELLKN